MNLLASALNYAARGIAVFPLKPRSKLPATANGFKAATTDSGQIKRWWSACPDYNIGIATGDIVVLDVDKKSGGLDSLGLLPEMDTLHSRTGGGGFHYLFRSSEQFRNKAGFKPGLDIRGEGGYIVAPPSVHESGERYQWINEGTEISDIPLWLERMLHQESSPKKMKRAGGAKEGGRNDFLARRAGALQRANALTFETLQSINERDCDPPLDEWEVRSIVDSVGRYEPVPDADGGGQRGPAHADIAERFLDERGYRTERGTTTLIHWEGDWYRWNGTHYALLSDDAFENDIIRWVQSVPAIRGRATQKFARELMVNIRAMLPQIETVPCYISDTGQTVPADNWISMKNGILQVSRLLAGEDDHFRPHTEKFVTVSSLPYEYKPGVRSQKWESFIQQVQPMQATRELLQEWAGYNLVYDITQAKFMLLEGDGANGKSVYCLVLRELVGNANVSAVGLEAFNPERTFPLAATKGKLANIVEEMGEIQKAAEGLLKTFVTGGAIQAERKHRDPFMLVPTARLTFATNVLPRFTDRSEGLWRRLLFVPFKFQILDEGLQDKSLIRGDTWRPELSGIFNWALEGLRRLNENGRFTTSKQAELAKSVYQSESNPARAFVQSAVTETATGRVSFAALKAAYDDWARLGGFSSLNAVNFCREVRKAFPKVKQTKDAQRLRGGRSRIWYGIQLDDAKSDIPDDMPWDQKMDDIG